MAKEKKEVVEKTVDSAISETEKKIALYQGQLDKLTSLYGKEDSRIPAIQAEIDGLRKSLIH